MTKCISSSSAVVEWDQSSRCNSPKRVTRWWSSTRTATPSGDLHHFHGKTIVGSGFDRDVLFQADARRANALAAVTSGDNTNILCARIARDNYEIKNVVARIYDPARADIYMKLGIPTVATSLWTTQQVKRWMLPADDSVEWTAEFGHPAPRRTNRARRARRQAAQLTTTTATTSGSSASSAAVRAA